MTTFGQVRGQIRIDAAQAIAEYAAVRAANASTMAALRSASTTLVGVGLGLAAAGGGMVALFGKAVSAAATFQKKIDFFGAVTDATQQDMDAVAKKALEMGKTTIFSANQMADAFVEFGKAGVSTKDILGGVADAVVALASAADINLTQASDIIISTMQTFKLGAGQTTHIADLLAGAANSSIVEVQDLGVSLKYVGGIAAATGIPLESVVTALSLLGQAGIKGSTAGTSLRQILVSLNATSAKSAKTLEALGIITKNGTNLFIDQAGHLKPLDQVFQILKTHTANLTDAQRLSALKIIFNNRALAAANILLKDGAKGFEQMSGAINKVTASDVAHKRLDNLAGDWLRLKNTIQTMLIQAGGPFQNFMRQLVQGLTAVVKAFGNLNPHIQTAVFAFIGIFGALLLVSGIILLVAGAIGKMIVAFKALKAAMILVRAAALLTTETFTAMWIAIFGPVSVVVAIIVAVIAVIVLLYLKVKVVRDFINAAGRDIVAAFKAVVRWFSGLPAFFEGVWNKIVSGVTTAWNAVKQAVLTAVNAVKNAVVSVWQGIDKIIVQPILTAAAAVKAAWDAIFNAFSTAISEVIGFIQRNWRVLILITGPLGIAIDIVTAHWNLIKNAFTTAMNAILAAVRFVFNLIYTAIAVQVRAVFTVVTTVWNALSLAASTAFNAMKTVIVPIINFLVAFFRLQFNIMKAVVTAQFNAMLAVTRAVWGAIQATVRAAVNTVLAIVRGITQVATIVGNAFRSAYNAVVSVVGTIVGYLRGFMGRILGAIGDVVSPMARVGKNMIGGLYNGVLDAMSAVWNFFRGLLGTILRQIGDPLQFLYDVGRAMIQGLINGIESMVSSAVGAVKHAVGGVINGAKSLLGINSPSRVFAEFGMGIMEGLAKGIKDNHSIAQKALDGLSDLLAPTSLAINSTFGPAQAMNGNTKSLPTPTVTVQGGNQNVFHVTVAVDADKISSVQHLLDIFDDIPRAAGANS